MGRLIYAMQVSLDGYVEDATGDFAFAEPDEEVHRAANRQAEESSAFLYGRRLYEVMEGYWPAAAASNEEQSEVEAEFARAYVQTPRIVFSDTLETVAEGCRLVRSADAVAEVTRLKQESDSHLDLGGPALAASLVDLIDEFRLFVFPFSVGGGGKPYWPAGQQIPLHRVDQHTYGSGVVLLRYERTR